MKRRKLALLTALLISGTEIFGLCLPLSAEEIIAEPEVILDEALAESTVSAGEALVAEAEAVLEMPEAAQEPEGTDPAAAEGVQADAGSEEAPEAETEPAVLSDGFLISCEEAEDPGLVEVSSPEEVGEGEEDNVVISRSYGDDSCDRIYSDRPLELTLGLNNELADLQGFTVAWTVTEADSPEQGEEEQEESCCTALTASEDGMFVTATLSEDFTDRHESGTRGVWITARVLDGENEAGSASIWAWLMAPYVEYQTPEDGELVCTQEYYLQKSMNYSIQNGEHPEGMDDSTSITDYKLAFYVWDEEAEAVDGEKWQPVDTQLLTVSEDENGWHLTAGQESGMAEVTITYDAADGSGSESSSFRIYIGGTVYRQEWEYPNGQQGMAPGASMEIPLALYVSEYNPENGQVPETAVSFTARIQEGWTSEVVSAAIHENVLTITGLEEGDDSVPVEYYVTTEDGEQCVLTESIPVSVWNYSMTIVPGTLTTEQKNLRVGETFTLTPQLVRSYRDEDGVLHQDVVDAASFRWAGLDSNVWSYDEEKVNAYTSYGEALPVLTREECGNISVAVAAYAPDENMEPQQITELWYQFNYVSCGLEVEASYGSDGNLYLYDGADNSLTLTLHATNVADSFTNYDVSWNVRVDGEEYSAESMPWLAIAEGGNHQEQLTLTVTEEGHEYSWIEVEPVLNNSRTGIEEERICEGIEVRSSRLYLPGAEDGVIRTVIGAGVMPDRVQEDGTEQLELYVEDKNHPGGAYIMADWISTQILDPDKLELRRSEYGTHLAATAAGEAQAVLILRNEELWGNDDYELTITYEIEAERYHFYLEIEEGRNEMLPGEEITLTPVVYRNWYDKESQEPTGALIDRGSYTVTWSVDDESIARVEENSEGGATVTAVGQQGNTGIQAKAVIGDGDIELEAWTDVHVVSYYYEIQYAGDQAWEFDEKSSLVLSPQLIRIGTHSGETEIAAEWNLTTRQAGVTITEGEDGFVLTVDENFVSGQEQAWLNLTLTADFNDNGYDSGRRESYPSIAVKKHVHTESDWKVLTPATLTMDGTEGKICTVCGEIRETRPIEAVYRDHFVARAYRAVLGREADTAGFKHFKNQLDNGVITAAEFFENLIISDEFRSRNTTNAEYIEILYQGLFGRNSDEGGKAAHVANLEKGVSRIYSLWDFTCSAEFAQICERESLTAGTVDRTQSRDQNIICTAFVNRCYLTVLGREGEEGGLNHWTEAILRGAQTYSDVIRAFTQSAEFTGKNLSNEEFVKVLYRAFMGREYDQGGLENWCVYLEAGNSRLSAVDAFANSEEFQNILKTY